MVVSGKVRAVTGFGVFVYVGEESVLVHGFEQSWYWPFIPSRHFRVGQHCTLWLFPPEFDSSNGQRFGSFRRLHPEQDPSSRIRVGDRLAGIVLSRDADGLSVEFGKAQLVDFPAATFRNLRTDWQLLSPGDAFRVVVESLRSGPTIMLRPDAEIEDA
jgi:ribosomal protein S1